MPTRDSISDALTRALATPEHRFGVFAALVSYAAGETAARVQLPPPPPALCGQCQEPISTAFLFRGVEYCSNKCCHDAGDRTTCRRGCGCTGFAIKRRQLRNHRQEMRIMEQLLNDYDMDGVLARRRDELGGRCTSLEMDSEMDEGSDAEGHPGAADRDRPRDRRAVPQHGRVG
jgi:hypothetical protein